MMWDSVVRGMIALIEADSTLVGIFGSAIRRASSGDLAIPGLEWTLVSDTETELWAPCIIQWDIWTETHADNQMAEVILRAMFSRDAASQLDGNFVLMNYLDGAVLAAPNRHGFAGRALRFMVSPLRRAMALREHVIIP